MPLGNFSGSSQGQFRAVVLVVSVLLKEGRIELKFIRGVVPFWFRHGKKPAGLDQERTRAVASASGLLGRDIRSADIVVLDNAGQQHKKGSSCSF